MQDFFFGTLTYFSLWVWKCYWDIVESRLNPDYLMLLNILLFPLQSSQKDIKISCQLWLSHPMRVLLKRVQIQFYLLEDNGLVFQVIPVLGTEVSVSAWRYFRCLIPIWSGFGCMNILKTQDLDRILWGICFFLFLSRTFFSVKEI